MSLKIDTALLQTCQNVLHSWFKYVGFGQLKHIFKHTFAHRKLLSAGNESEVVGEKVTFSHSTETFQCQTSLLCPPHHMWRRNIQYISHVPLIEYIICISTHCAQFTHSASVHVRVYILYLFFLNNFFPQLIEHAGRVVGYVKRHCVVYCVPWLWTAGSCAWHQAQKQGEDKHSQQTLTDIHKSADTYLLHRTNG